jgi:hypothetical protein
MNNFRNRFAAAIVSFCVGVAQAQGLHCDESEPQAFKDLRVSINEAAANPKTQEAPDVASLVTRLQMRLDDRALALASGDCDTADEDRKIAELAERLNATLGTASGAALVPPGSMITNTGTTIHETPPSSNALGVSGVNDSSTSILAIVLKGAFEIYGKRLDEKIARQNQPAKDGVLTIRVVAARIVDPVRRIATKTEAPVRGSQIVIEPWDTQPIPTSMDGVAKASGRVGPVFVRVSAPGYEPRNVSTSVSSEGSLLAVALIPVIPVAKEQVVQGVVKRFKAGSSDVWGAAVPVRDANVTIEQWRRSVRTDLNGRFAISGPPGPVTVKVTSGNLQVGGKARPNQEVRVLLRDGPALPKGLTSVRLTGRVVAPNGKPVPNATVQVRLWNRSVTTSSSGAYELKGPAGSVVMLVTAPQFRPSELRVLANEPHEVRNVVMHH